MVLKIVLCFLVGGSLAASGMWLMNRADRRGVSLWKMTIEVMAAAICFLVAVTLLLVGTYSLADFLWNLGR